MSSPSPGNSSSGTSYSFSTQQLRERGAQTRDILPSKSPTRPTRTPSSPPTDSAPPPPNNNEMFECNICLETARNPVVTLCGHLYCWPCIFEWMTGDRSAALSCPVCKSEISREKCVPIYGRGQEEKDDPRNRQCPKRPQGRRTEVPSNGRMGGGGPAMMMGGNRYQFGVAFGFPFFGLNIINNNNTGNAANVQPQNQQLVSQLFMMLGLFVIMYIMLII